MRTSLSVTVTNVPDTGIDVSEGRTRPSISFTRSIRDEANRKVISVGPGSLRGSSCQECRLFAGEPGTIFRGLVNVFNLQFRVVLNDFLRSIAIAKEFQDKIDRHSKPADDRLPTADIRINDNSIKHASIFRQSADMRKLFAKHGWTFNVSTLRTRAPLLAPLLVPP